MQVQLDGRLQIQVGISAISRENQHGAVEFFRLQRAHQILACIFAESDSEGAENSNALNSNTLISDAKESLSASKVLAYEQYGEDLKLLKTLVKQYCSKQKYFQFFKGEFYSPTELHPQKYVYDKSKIDGYTKYNEIHSWSYDDFRKSVEKLFANTEAVNDSRYHQMMDRFKDRRFFVD